MTLIATHSGLRGRPGAELTAEVIERAVAGLVELIRGRGLDMSLGVARDERPAGAALAADVIRIIRQRGADVVDFGVLSTPGAKLTTRSRGLGGAVIVTGSHLEPELNGLKLVAGPHYGPVDVRELPAPGRPTGTRRRGRLWRDEGAASAHVAAICASIDTERVRRSGLSVECIGGAGRAPSLLLEALGLRSAAGAAMTLYLDPDGDRVQLGDELGTLLDAELTLPLAILARNATRLVKGADTSRIVETLVERRGGTVEVVCAGEIHLVAGVLKTGADLAGEGNGGVIVPDVGLARDGLAAAAAIMELVARTRRPLSAWASELPRYERRRSTIGCADRGRAQVMLETLARRMAVEPNAEPEQGIRVNDHEGGWGLVRLSATEPVLRITAEGATSAQADGLHAELRAALLDGARAA